MATSSNIWVILIFNLFFLIKNNFRIWNCLNLAALTPLGLSSKTRHSEGIGAGLNLETKKEPKVKSLNIESTLFLTFSSYNFLTNQTLQPRVSFILSLVEIRWLNVTAHSHKRFGFHKPYSKFFCKVSNQYSGESSPNEPKGNFRLDADHFVSRFGLLRFC